MSEYTQFVQSEPPTGFAGSPCEPASVGGVRCLTDEARLPVGDMGREHPAGDSDARAFGMGFSVAYDDGALETLQPTAAPIKPVAHLSEALWLAQEELAEEQRQRAEERRQFAIVQDEYLRLQVESASTSRRHTAAEASAAACRSLAAEALADKEYVVRILGRTHQEGSTASRCSYSGCSAVFLSSLVLSEMVAQGNTIVALLARRWPEAELRKQIDASGLSDQPLSQWAISHCIKTRESQKVFSPKNSALPVPADQRHSGVPKRHAIPHPEGAQSEDIPSLFSALPALKAEGKYGAPAADSRLISGGTRREADSKMDPSVGVDAATSALSAGVREACQRPQDSARASEQGNATVNARMPHSAVSDRRTDITYCAARRDSQAEAKSLDLPPLPSTMPRPQSVTQCRPKLPDAATSLPSKISRQAVPPLPLGRGSGQRSAVPSARDLNQVSALNCFLRRTDGGGDAPSAAVTKASVRKAKTCKEQGISHREAQHHSSRPASVRSVSRSGMKHVKDTLPHVGSSMPVGTGTEVRATQPISTAAALRTGSLPSRKTCGAVLSVGSSEVSKRAAGKTLLRDNDDDALARKALRQLSSAEAPKLSSAPCPVSSSQVNAAQQPKKKLPPLPPSLRCPSFTHEEGSSQHLERPATTVSAATSQEESSKGRGPSSGASSRRVEGHAATVSARAGPVQTEQIRKNHAGQSTIYKANHATGTHGTVELKSSTVLRSSLPPNVQDPRQQDFSLPCLPIKAVVASVGCPWQGSQQPCLIKEGGGVAGEKSESVQSHLANSLAAAGAQNQNSEASRQHVICEPNLPRYASGPSEGAALRGPAASHQQLPPGTKLKTPGEWPLKPSFAAPQRSSLPPGYPKGLTLMPQPPAQHQRPYAPAGEIDSVLRPAAAVPQRQTVLPASSSNAGLQQQYLMQQHQLRQQQLMYQAQHARQAFHLQKQMGVGGLQFFMNNGGPAFVARQHAPPWSPVYSGAIGR
ncbi:hypothetical protein ACSSS7_001800 [Eimeria intestinalis]